MSTTAAGRPIRPAPPRRVAEAIPPALALDRYTVRQQLLTVTAQRYDILDDSGAPVLFAERPAHALRNAGAGLASGSAAVAVAAGFIWLGSVLPELGTLGVVIFFTLAFSATIVTFVYGMSRLGQKRHITCYFDATKAAKAFEVRQNETVAGLTSTFTVLDAAGRPLAAISKNMLTDAFRKKWLVKDPRSGRTLLVAKEDSILRALLRRLVSQLVLLHFVLCQGESDMVLGEFKKEFRIRDVYVLDLTRDRLKSIDRRVAVAIGILLDTGERR